MRTAPDRCPGALRVHDAVDGGLVRVRVPGGFLSASQVRALAALSAELGDGHLDLTSRGNVQLRGLRSQDGLAPALTDAGLLPSLAHDTARNVVASPLADNRAQVSALDAGICAAAELAELPGRFLLAVDDGSGDVLSLRPDLALQDGLLVIAGRVAGPGGPADVLEAARAFLSLRTTEWQLREVPDGAARLVAALGRTLSGRARVGAAPAPGRHGDRVVAAVPLGRLTSTALRSLGAIRVTPWRTVVLDGPVHGLVDDAASPWVGVTACAGLACTKTHQDVRTAASRHLVPGPRPVHWSGCERRCGLPKGDVLDVLATPDGWTVDGVPTRDLAGRLVGSRT